MYRLRNNSSTLPQKRRDKLSSSSPSLIQNPPSKQKMSLILQFKSLSLSTPFLHGGASSNVCLPKTFSTATPPPPPPTPTFLPVIRAMKSMQGRVTSSSHDKTVSVQVVRLASHPKYKRRVRMKKKYQAHDPLNKFSVGDVVQLEKIRPISKLKTFLAVPVPSRGGPKAKDSESQELGLPLESQQP